MWIMERGALAAADGFCSNETHAVEEFCLCEWPLRATGRMRAKPLIEMMIPEKEEACVRTSKRMTGQERLGRGEKNVKRIEGKEKNRKSLTENVRELEDSRRKQPRSCTKYTQIIPCHFAKREKSVYYLTGLEDRCVKYN